ncbi:MAG: hypothetical protein IK031_04645 [Bacteroidales bacterium]|nr:hypothetical protein [Bacteroidales bacterium]
MKRFYIPFLLMAAAAVTACETKAVIDESADGTYIFTLQASTPDVATKSDYSNDGVFSWSSSDKISVLFHNGSTDKFFTLSAKSVNGKDAVFSGSVDNGYTLGSSTDGTKWALYPAGSHSVRFAETDGEKYPLLFNIPATTDYTKSGFSASIPMYAQGDDSNVFEFHHLCSAYKFTFTDISAASKVKLTIQNQTTYRLSGDVKLRNQGGTYLDQGWADGEDKTLTFISNVSSGKAVFYVPVRYYAACFQPIITLSDAATDGQIYTKTATTAKAIEEKGHIQPVNISVSGAVVVPWSYDSVYGVNWKGSNVVSDAGQTGFNKISAVADATYLYMLGEIQKNALSFDTSHYRENSVNFYVNGQSKEFGFLTKQGVAEPNDYSSYVEGKNVLEHNGVMYFEWKINRAAAKAKDEAKLGPLADSGSVELRLCVFPKVGVTEDWNALATTDWNVYMYAPASGNLTVTLP